MNRKKQSNAGKFLVKIALDSQSQCDGWQLLFLGLKFFYLYIVDLFYKVYRMRSGVQYAQYVSFALVQSVYSR